MGEVAPRWYPSDSSSSSHLSCLHAGCKEGIATAAVAAAFTGTVRRRTRREKEKKRERMPLL